MTLKCVERKEFLLLLIKNMSSNAQKRKVAKGGLSCTLVSYINEYNNSLQNSIFIPVLVAQWLYILNNFHYSFISPQREQHVFSLS